MSKDNNISITPTTSEYEVGGGYGAITTSGSSSTWTAAVSDDWIVLKSTTGTVGKGCAYTVTASTNVETRTGYVYVSGHVHTVKQAGWGATIPSNNAEVECDGGTGTIDVTVGGKYGWNARPNVDWLSVTPTRGVGSGQVTYQVAPWHEVSTRSGTLTVAGNTFTVFQYGKRMKLSSYKETRNYETHVIPITVDALAITKWSVTPNASWISVVDSDNGRNRQGGSALSIAIGENPSYKERTGTVTIGTETLTIVQEGRTALSFAIDPETTTADVGGANGLIAVTATPDLPWTSASAANWLTIYPKFKTGTGNGNVVYTASPNPTLYDRTGTITITPEAASGVAAKTHTVTQPAAVSSISLTGYEFEAAGENCAVEVTVDDIVEWKVEGVTDWLTVVGDTTRVGSATITLQAAENTTVYPRTCTLTIARKTFSVSQKGRGVTVDTDSFVFGTKSQGSSFTVKPDGNVSWTPVSSDDSWLILLDDETRTGNGEVQFVVTMYNGTGEARTGTITVGDKVVYITQRAFDLSISPTGAWVTGNAGAGEIGVSADIGAVWNAIVTEPWIKVISGYDSGTGSGIVRYTYEDNNTGKTRSGKIVISGTAYTIEQAARVIVSVKTEAGNGGSVSGGGSYSLGTEVTLTAIPADGYAFAYWEGDVSSMQNPITVTADVAKSVKAIFMPLTPEFISVSNSTDGVTLVWTNLAWATEYNIYRAPTSSRTGGPLATLVADGTHSYIDTTGDVDTPYWYWVEAVGAVDTNECVNPVSGKKLKPIIFSNITYANLRGASHTNPATYQEETSFAFSVPTTGVTGYTFDKWVPAGITANMTGDQIVTANWTANEYQLVFHANGGSGTMANQVMKYDAESAIAPNAFVRSGYAFEGWATEPNGEVVYADGANASNLTAHADGEVELYAVWVLNTYSIAFRANGGSGTMANQVMTYDAEASIASNAFVRSGYKFIGWATDAAGNVAYEDGATVSNLTTRAGGLVELYAVWKISDDTHVEVRDGVEWTFMVTSDVATIKAVPKDVAGAVLIPSTLGGFPVVDVGQEAFSDCSGLTSVTIPSSVTNICSYAFRSCTGITSVTIPACVTELSSTFPSSYQSITNVIICDGVTSISDNAFAKCSGLTSVTIPSSVTNIGSYAFVECSGLTSVTIPMNVTEIGDTAFGGCSGLTSVTIPSSVTYIGQWAFAACSGLTSVTLHEGVTEIGDNAFQYCRGLTSVTIPSSMTGIYTYTFADCSGLRSVTIPSSVTRISNHAFANCSGLTSVTIPSSVMSIGSAAFEGCSGLTSVVFEGAPPSYLSSAGISTDTPIRYNAAYAAEWLTVINQCGFTNASSYMLDQWSIMYDNLRGASHGNPTNYIEGDEVALIPPTGVVTGYTFSGWIVVGDGFVVTQNVISADMVGDLVISAQWKANDYEVHFNANCGLGTMANQSMTYDAEAKVTSNAFARSGYMFAGWATELNGDVVYADGAVVSNLTTLAGGIVELYAVWKGAMVSDPVIVPAHGTTFKTDSCTVTITSATEGATIYYSVNGRTPSVAERYRYTGPFTITETSEITAFAYKDGVSSDYVDATITKVEPEPLTLKSVLDETKLGDVASTGDAAWTPIDDLTAAGGSCAISGIVEDSDETGASSCIAVAVMGAGTLSFNWRVDCEPDPRDGKYTYDHAEFWVDDETKPRVRIDGKTGWVNFSTEITTEGTHTLVWKYVSDGYLPESGTYESCVWLDNLSWSGSAFVSDPIPDIGENPTKAQIAAALGGSADAKLSACITNVANYNAYREWAGKVKGSDGSGMAGAQGVKDSPTAWVSFALGSDKLLEAAPKDEDLAIEAFEPTSTTGKFDFTVSVEDVDVGSGAQTEAQVEQVKENLKQVLGLEGATSLDSSAFNSDNVDITFGTPVDGKVRITAQPKATTDTFFMKVKVK